jgi:peptide/nickel transport system substrate-binding protein
MNRLLIFLNSLFTTLLIVALSFLVAYGAETPGRTPSPQYGGILRIGYGNQNIISLGFPPTMSGAQDGYQSEACLDTLFRYDEKANLVPRLATDWKVSTDTKSITLTLRQGVTFHDGSDFNAEVAKWNLENYMRSPKTELQSIKSVDILDKYTIRLNLSEYDSLLIDMLASDPGRMISKKAFESKGQAWCEKNPVGTGPFKFVRWEKDVLIKYEKFDQYWEKNRPYLAGVEMIFFADTTTAVMAFKNGEIDILYAFAQNAKDLAAEGKYQFSILPFGQQPFLAGDSLHPDSPFANIKVRQAMSYAIDNAAISKALGYGYWVPLNQWAAPKTPAYNPNVIGYPYNPEKAKKLLAEAGYPNGFETKIYYYATEARTPQVTAEQGYLTAVGIKAQLEPLQRAKYNIVATEGGWKNGICEVLTFSRPDILFSMKPIVTHGSVKFPSMLRPPEYEELFVQALKATDVKTKMARTQDLMKMGTDKYCVAHWLWVQTDIMVKQPRVHDDLFGEIPGWYLSPDAWLSK